MPADGEGGAEGTPGAEPRFFNSAKDGPVRCGLCPRRCLIPAGAFGSCRVRGNRDGAGTIPFYGFITALAEDPVEKKPLYHWRPGSSVFSAGFAGCNLRCPFCQNWSISQTTEVSGRRFSPGELIAAVRSRGGVQIAYTYSEPLVHIEYLLDCMALARGAGIANILVSSGCINAGPAAEILALTDAANIDLKCFSEESYTRILGGNLKTALHFISAAYTMGVHLELTTLIVPGLNDGPAELRAAAGFIAGLSPAIPWHLSAYHPDWRWNAPPTDPAKLAAAAREARRSLSYVYAGNVPGERNDTPCPRCKRPLVERRGYRINTSGLVSGPSGYCCARCGEPVSFVRGG
ncbi:MAG: AmmeMemoRadiSam system radical SAM enzyme [Treponema sp.]|jgi:pyruvate formate lyase activating enzyme|nr:AmmeMemoRadiSam system radical SAM enzyme [Treponema sp.]